jgi:hypothetical protein
MNRIRVFLIVTCIIAVTPCLSADIILVTRLSDAEARVACEPGSWPPPQSQTGFLPANLRNSAGGHCHFPLIGGDCDGFATVTSNSSILINNPMEGLRVVGDGTASVSGCSAFASAKLIVLNFTLTEVSYPYSITGQLNGSNATATLTGETGTIFERIGTTTLSESGTLLPGNYTLSVEVQAAGSNANFIFALDGLVSTPRVTNLSTRLLVGTGNDVGIGGFIVTGSGPRHLLLRGIGPSLNGIISDALPDPSLQLRGPTGFQTLTNDNWRDTQEAEIIATGRAPSNDLESAIVADLAPGTYTAILAGNAGTTGVGLLEIYDLSTNQDSGLSNISTRGNVGTGSDIMIAGLIVDGGGGADAIIIRGLGPSLAAFGIPNWLPNPQLELRNSNGVLLRSNNNWMDDPAQAVLISAAGLAPGNTLEATIVESLSPGTYTALLSGRANVTGIGLVEVYDHVTFGPTPTPGPTSTPTPRPTPSQLTNLSTRMMVQSGDGAAIAGFIILGSGEFLLRGIGPSLSGFGVPNALPDPVLELHGNDSATNDNWRDTQEAEIIGTGRAPSNDLESAIYESHLGYGGYTAILKGNAGTTGVGSVEIYYLSPDSTQRLTNFSTRAYVGTGDDIAIGGFILGAGGGGADAIILRGLGPSLTQFGVPALADPKLELRNSQGALIASDDNWMDDPNQAAIISDSGLAPTNNLESAIAVTLMPGPYTALLSGVNNGTGIGLVEVYDLNWRGF